MNSNYNNASQRSHRLNELNGNFNTFEHGTSQRKQGIYSPNVSNRDMHSPRIFPPPKIIDRKASLASSANNDNKQIMKKKSQKRQSLNDLYHKYGGTSHQEGKSPRKTVRSPKKHALKRGASFKYEEELKQQNNNTATDSNDSVAKDKSLLHDKAKQNTANKITSMLNEISREKKEHEIEKLAKNNRGATEIGKAEKESINKNSVTEMKDNFMEASSPDTSNRSSEFFGDKEDAPLSNNKSDKESLVEQNPEENANRNEASINEFPLKESSNNMKDTDMSLSNDIPIQSKVNAIKNKKKLVKLPVLLANVVFDIDIQHSIPSEFPIERVTGIDWSLQSVITRVILPSNTVFFKGVLIADMEYVSDQTNTLHTRKVPIAWERIVHVDWLTSPEKGSECRNEYTFHSSNQDFSTHHEVSQSFTDMIEDDLRSIHFIWHNNLDDRSNSSNITIQGTAAMSMNLLQKQYISI